MGNEHWRCEMKLKWTIPLLLLTFIVSACAAPETWDEQSIEENATLVVEADTEGSTKAPTRTPE